ncbi:MAG: hypothetical protein NTW10_01880 [Bacteroidetes bacterium]|nr:hypothetical protein [Bacteroidota bacterium]
MKAKILFLISIVLVFWSSETIGQVSISTDGSAPDGSAMLDIKSTSKGFLLPRVALTSSDAPDPVSSPATGLILYNTATFGTPPNNVTPGYYCWSGTRWIPVAPPQGTHVGDLLCWDGVQWTCLPPGSDGSALIVTSGMPGWGQISAEIPTLQTYPASSITALAAFGGGNVVDGRAIVTERGVCWSTSANPTTSDNRTSDGLGCGTFTSTLTGLTANTIYYIRAYATNSVGTGYGNEVSFTTGAIALTTTSASSVTCNSAVSGGNITNDGGNAITARGVCWSTSSNPTTTDSHTTDGSGTGFFTSSLTGLTQTTMYYVRAYATNGIGTSYGNEISFTTSMFFYIGQSYGGGIVFYLDGSGQHGLISSTIDQSPAPWGCYGTSIAGTSFVLGSGQTNTTLIINGCPTPGIAARVCDDLVLNGYSDWFLPSKDELTQMYLQKTVIGGFANDYYWTSSQSTSNWAILQYFGDGTRYFGVKSTPRVVRAIRAF